MKTAWRVIALTVTLIACSDERQIGDGGADATESDAVSEAPEAGLVVLATGGAGVIALNATSVFWVDQVPVLGAIKQCAKSGGPTSTLVADHARGLLVADTSNVYWTDWQPPAVMQCSTAGCAQPITLWSDLDAGAGVPQGLAADGTRVYWSMPNGTIMSCAIGGCNATPSFVYSTPGASAEGIAVDANNVYWSNVQGDVMSCPKTGCTTPVVLASYQTANALAVDAANLYWAGGGSVFKCAVGGCGTLPTPIASYLPQGAIGQLVTDGANVYWTIIFVDFPPYPVINNSGSVNKCSIDGCGSTPTALAAQADEPYGLAVDGTSLYWTVSTGAKASIVRLTPK